MYFQIKDLVEKLRIHFPDSVGEPLSPDTFLRFCKFMSKKGFPDISPDLFELFQHSDGLAFNGIEIFSCRKYSVSTINYRLTTLFNANKYYRKYYSDCELLGEKDMFIGKSDEELFLYDSITGSYRIAAREDLMTYEEDFIFEKFLNTAFLGRIHESLFDENNIPDPKTESDKEEEIAVNSLTQRLLSRLLSEFIRINSFMKYPVSFNSIEIVKNEYPKLLCNLVLSEPSHIWKESFMLVFRADNQLEWITDMPLGRGKIYLKEIFSKQEIENLEFHFYMTKEQ